MYVQYVRMCVVGHVRTYSMCVIALSVMYVQYVRMCVVGHVRSLVV